VALPLLVVAFTLDLLLVEGLPGPHLRGLLRRAHETNARTTLPINLHRMALRMGMVLQHVPLPSKQKSAMVLESLLGSGDLHFAQKDAPRLLARAVPQVDCLAMGVAAGHLSDPDLLRNGWRREPSVPIQYYQPVVETE